MDERIGRYELIGTLGHGASATVYEALLHGPFGFTKPVALKVLDPDAPGDRYREARLASQLQHPNVVSVFAVEELDGRCCLAMELVKGLTARALVAAGPLPDRALVELGLQVLDALAHIHAHRLVHRDLKPANLLIDPQGTVKLTDLGVASPIGSEQNASGTYGYIPVEQCAGEARAASDLFAFGVTLHRLGTGRPLFDRGPVALVQAAEADSHLAKSGALDAVEHPGLRDVIARCVRETWTDRPRSAEVVSEALARLVAPGLAGASLRDVVRERFGEPDPVVPAARGPSVLGRDALVRELLDQLTDHRWLTLHGEGGIGKSSVLGLLAGELDAVVVDVDGERSVADLASRVARRLGARLPEHGQLTEVCDGWSGTLLLDHIEEVEGWDDAVAQALAANPELQIVVATVVVLHRDHDDELRVPVAPLAADVAAELYRVRSGGGTVAPAELAALEGNPLAIELAAAGPFETHPTGDSRHTSLDASLAATWRYLPSWGPAAVARLASFEDGFTVQAAGAVLGGGAPEPLEVLDRLKRAGLLRFSPARERFRLPRHVREHARRLDPEEAAVGVDRHLAWYAQLGSPAMLRALHEPENTALRRQVVDEVRDLEAAARHALSNGDGDAAHATALVTSWAWSFDGPAPAAREILEDVVEVPGPRLAEIHLRLSYFAMRSDDTDEALRLAARARELARLAGTTKVELQAEQRLGQILLRRGELVDARRVIQRCLARAARAGDSQHQASASILLSSLAMREGDIEGSLILNLESARFSEAVRWANAEMVAWTNAGLVHTELGDDEAALDCIEKARRRAIEMGDNRRRISATIWIAEVRVRSDDHEGAARELDAVRGDLARLQDDVFDARVLVLDGTIAAGQADPERAVDLLVDGSAALGALDAEEGAVAGVELASLLVELGEAERADQVVQRSLRVLPEARWKRVIAHLLALRARTRRRPADLRRAWALVEGLQVHPRVLRAIRAAEADLA